MDSAPELRIIAKTTIGVDDVDLEAATERVIMVTHCPTESNWGGVAEGTMAIMLSLLKKVRERDDAVKRGEWRDPSLQGFYLGRRQDGYAGLTIGIIGLGRIGRRFADLLTPWRIRLLACDPYVDISRFILSNAERVDLETLLKESDIVSLHVALTNETRKMIGARELTLMKPDAILINTSRGQVVDETALAEALQSDKLLAAGIDVFEDEPPPTDSPLLKLGHKVLLSPHMATSNLKSGLKPGVEWATRSVFAALRGEVPDNVYNKEVIPKWLERFGGRRVAGLAKNI
jgi:phosphoglycerate dehydrogenase-like enzyme